jgi:hypothetical protein
MTCSIQLDRLLLIGLAALVAAWPLAQAAHAGPSAPEVPSKIQVLGPHKVFLVGHAAGVQIYSCKTTADGYGWGPAVPRANLYDDQRKLLATHFGGPTWQARDGSKVVGSVVDRVTVDPTAVPWLLLSAAATPGPDGDRLAGTTYIQRIATSGGLAPAVAECNAGTAGTTQEIPYTADYYFWKAAAD